MPVVDDFHRNLNRGNLCRVPAFNKAQVTSELLRHLGLPRIGFEPDGVKRPAKPAMNISIKAIMNFLTIRNLKISSSAYTEPEISIQYFQRIFKILSFLPRFQEFSLLFLVRQVQRQAAGNGSIAIMARNKSCRKRWQFAIAEGGYYAKCQNCPFG